MFDGLIGFLSFFSKPKDSDNQSFSSFAESAMDNKTMEKETERQKSRGDMEEAIREMEEAKARLDEHKRQR
ncbi:hypothetical protein [uncultured Roseobacter sp.]|uniref:hypothetical protein n=1 Tax=uncultured Roseobacter sp. TaxID=114847 RepID=UPI0026362FA6|nr:hypothetical protein [uncultured Roseobacter sp.]